MDKLIINCCVKLILSKSAIAVFWHKLDSPAEKTHLRVTTDQQI